jgi:hypothetical protein
LFLVPGSSYIRFIPTSGSSLLPVYRYFWFIVTSGSLLLPVHRYFRFIIISGSSLLPVHCYFRFIVTSGSLLLPVHCYFRFIITSCSSLLPVHRYFRFIIISGSSLLPVLRNSFRCKAETETRVPRLASIRTVLTGSFGFLSASPKSGKEKVSGNPMRGSPIMKRKIVATKRQCYKTFFLASLTRLQNKLACFRG